MEQRIRPVAAAHAVFAAQTHRRFIKSHTPLDGVPRRDDVRYVCMGRDPRDAAVSMIHHGENMDRERFRELIGADPQPEAGPPPPKLTFEERFDRWIDDEQFPSWSVRFLAHHYATFWEARHRPNVELFHFEDYRRDLPGEVRRLAGHLGIPITAARAQELAAEATIERARSRATDVAPDAHLGLWRDPARFFRSGTSGEGLRSMTLRQRESYDRVVAEIVSPDLARWMHHGRG
jgi:hypothetical protein